MKRLLFFSVVTLLFLLNSCAPVSFYSKLEDGKSRFKKENKTGLKIYTAKPYLVEERYSVDSAKTTIVYLPDLARPTYVRVRGTLGKNNLKLDLNNGMLTSYGHEADTEISDAVNSFAGLAGGLLNISGEEPATEAAQDSTVTIKDLHHNLLQLEKLLDKNPSLRKDDETKELLKTISKLKVELKKAQENVVNIYEFQVGKDSAIYLRKIGFKLK